MSKDLRAISHPGSAYLAAGKKRNPSTGGELVFVQTLLKSDKC